jgi:putative hemolysin
MTLLNKFYVLIGIVILVLISALSWYYQAKTSVPPAEEFLLPSTVQEDSVKIPNPASVYCTEKLNGVLQLLKTAEGQVGICFLPDGRRCEEWELYRTGNCNLPPELEEVIPAGKG